MTSGDLQLDQKDDVLVIWFCVPSIGHQGKIKTSSLLRCIIQGNCFQKLYAIIIQGNYFQKLYTIKYHLGSFMSRL